MSEEDSGGGGGGYCGGGGGSSSRHDDDTGGGGGGSSSSHHYRRSNSDRCNEPAAPPFCATVVDCDNDDVYSGKRFGVIHSADIWPASPTIPRKTYISHEQERPPVAKTAIYPRTTPLAVYSDRQKPAPTFVSAEMRPTFPKIGDEIYLMGKRTFHVRPSTYKNTGVYIGGLYPGRPSVFFRFKPWGHVRTSDILQLATRVGVNLSNKVSLLDEDGVCWNLDFENATQKWSNGCYIFSFSWV